MIIDIFLISQCFKSLLIKAFHDNFFYWKKNWVGYILILVSNQIQNSYDEKSECKYPNSKDKIRRNTFFSNCTIFILFYPHYLFHFLVTTNTCNNKGFLFWLKKSFLQCFCERVSSKNKICFSEIISRVFLDTWNKFMKTLQMLYYRELGS